MFTPMLTRRRLSRLFFVGRLTRSLGWRRVACALVISALIATPASAQDLREEAIKGAELTAMQAAALEQQLTENPQNLVARSQLLGYYRAQQRSASEEHSRHLLWFILNAPESELFESAAARIVPFFDPEGYAAAKQAWLRLIDDEPENVVLLRHASRFLSLSDKNLAAEFLGRAEALEPSNPYWAEQLGRSRWREAHNPYEDTDAATAALALADFERAYELSDAEGCADLMPDLAVAAFAAGALEKASGYAEAMLAAFAGDRNKGTYIHYANLVLGRIALAEGNQEEAGARLLAAARTQGAPPRRYGGPDMALAKALLERGETETVLRYLELCLDLWERGEDDLRDWIVLIEAGRIPDFDHNFLF